jgi:hypothetical protein
MNRLKISHKDNYFSIKMQLFQEKFIQIYSKVISPAIESFICFLTSVGVIP